jgi:hypothetical protein
MQALLWRIVGLSVTDTTEKDEITRHDTTRLKLQIPFKTLGVC